MTYENLVKEAKKAVKTVDVKTIKEHLAVEFDIEGKGEGAFYVEFSANKVEVEPYEYYDHDFRIRTDAATALAILKGEVCPKKALEDGKLVAEGDAGKIDLLAKHLELSDKPATKKAPAKKPAAKKETAKKAAPAKKTTAKAAAKKEEAPKKEAVKKTATKEAAKAQSKPAAKKTVAKK